MGSFIHRCGEILTGQVPSQTQMDHPMEQITHQILSVIYQTCPQHRHQTQKKIGITILMIPLMLHLRSLRHRPHHMDIHPVHQNVMLNQFMT